MKALLVIIALLLALTHPAVVFVLTHPEAVVLVLGTELCAVAALGLLIFRRARPYRARHCASTSLWRSA